MVRGISATDIALCAELCTKHCGDFKTCRDMAIRCDEMDAIMEALVKES